MKRQPVQKDFSSKEALKPLQETFVGMHGGAGVKIVTLNIVLKGNVTGVYPFVELLSSITGSEIAIRPLKDCRL